MISYGTIHDDQMEQGRLDLASRFFYKQVITNRIEYFLRRKA